jgi:hypothetical protein
MPWVYEVSSAATAILPHAHARSARTIEAVLNPRGAHSRREITVHGANVWYQDQRQQPWFSSRRAHVLESIALEEGKKFSSREAARS